VSLLYDYPPRPLVLEGSATLLEIGFVRAQTFNVEIEMETNS